METQVSAEISYPADGNDLCFAIEDESFWFQHRNRCILEAVAQFPPAGEILDVGGGNGYVAYALQQAGYAVTLVEPGASGVRNARQRGVSAIQATMSEAGFVPDSIAAIGMFDVLEHIRDEAAFLQEAHRLLIDNGRLYLTVPAFAFLWSNEDDVAGHFRRYTTASLRRTLEASGFRIDYATYFFHFLPPLTFALRSFPYRLGLRRGAALTEAAMRAEHILSPTASALFAPLMDWETRRICKRNRIPFGGSCFVVASKR